MAAGWGDGDVEAVADCFTEHVAYTDPTRYRFERREQLLPFFAPPEGGSQWVTWHRILFDEAEQTGAAEYTYQGHHRYHGAVIVRLEGDRVAEWREGEHVSGRDWETVAGDGGGP